MRRFRPRFWPTLFTIPAVLLMLGLAAWQVQRLQWKTGLIEERRARSAAPAIALPPPGGDLALSEFRRVLLSGRFDHAHEFYVPARSRNGNVGLWVLTPFLAASGDKVLVNRGWVPEARRDPASRAPGQIAGATEIEAIIRAPQRRGWLQPENEPRRNRWFVIAPAEIEAFARLGLRRDLYLDAVAADLPGGLPIGGQTRIDLPNDHLQYAITWGALAIALLAIYILYHLREEKE